MAEMTQRLLTYEMATAATAADGEDASFGQINLARDASATSRCHMTNTTDKGHPLVYRCLVKMWPKITDQSGSGTGDEDTLGPDDDMTVVGGENPFRLDENAILFAQFLGVANNWVMRNGAKKTHAARESMFRKAGITKSQRGAYDDSIHYCFESGSETLLSPQYYGTIGQGSDLSRGSWELSKLIYPDDSDGAHIALAGSHNTEDSTTAFTTVVMPQLYLASRGEVEADSNVPETDSIAKHSILRKLLTKEVLEGTQDDIVDLASDNQDEPPYDLTEVNGDWGRKHELGRILCGGQGGAWGGSCIIDVPFGIFQIGVQLLNAAADVEQNVDFSVEVLDIYEM